MIYRVNPQRGFGGFGGLTDGTPPPRDLVVLIGVLFVTFSLQFFEATRGLMELFSLDLRVLKGYLWQLVSYPFVATPTSGFWFLLELLILFWFGRTVFLRLGQRRFWQVVLVAAAGASVAAVLVEWLLLALAPSVSHVPFLAMLGQRMLMVIVIAAFATLHGDATILLFFVLPLKARWFLWLEILFAFMAFLTVKDLAGLLGITAAVVVTYAALTSGGPRQAWRRLRLKVEGWMIQARLKRMRRGRRFDVIDGDNNRDRWVH